jgi:Fe-S-cluster containining protein
MIQSNDKIVVSINWELPEDEFTNSIDSYILEAKNSGKVLTLPLPVFKGEGFIYQMAMLLSQVNCKSCASYCCRHDVTGHGIGLSEYDVELLNEHGHGDVIKKIGNDYWIPMPCPFLHEHKCLIYDYRPTTCLCFPWDPGGVDGLTGEMLFSVESSCPEARRIIRNTYLTAWKFRDKMKRLHLYKGGE